MSACVPAGVWASGPRSAFASRSSRSTASASRSFLLGSFTHHPPEGAGPAGSRGTRYTADGATNGTTQTLDGSRLPLVQVDKLLFRVVLHANLCQLALVGKLLGLNVLRRVELGVLVRALRHLRLLPELGVGQVWPPLST
jgi:hypothetical protein